MAPPAEQPLTFCTPARGIPQQLDGNVSNQAYEPSSLPTFDIAVIPDASDRRTVKGTLRIASVRN